MPRTKEYKSKYPGVFFREDIKMWVVRIRKRELNAYETFYTKEEAERYFLYLQNSLLPSAIRTIDKNHNVTDIVEKYIQQVSETACKPYTVEGYRAFLNNHIKKFFKLKPAYTVTKDDVEEFKRFLVGSANLKHPNKKLGNATINKVLILLNAAFEHAVAGGLLLENPCLRVKKLPVIKKETNFLNTEELKKLLVVAKKDITITKYGVQYGEYYPIILLAILTGARQGELLALTWDDIDAKNNRIKITKSYSKGKLSQIPKTESSIRNTGNLPDFLFRELYEYKKQIKNNPHNLVFPSHEGNYRDGHNLTNRVLPRILKNAGLKKICWHSLRHSNITALAEAKVSPAYIQRTSGHSNLSTTLSIYTHVSDNMNIQAQQALEVFNV